jgi:N-acetylglucosaminyl-diphospho-decaprenol L-rhamnosyltransferase
VLPEPTVSIGSVTIVIVNYKVADCVLDCLRSLQAEVLACGLSQVIVVDNDSQDGSVDKISDAIRENQWQSWAMVVASEGNGGYAYGNNYAIRLTEQMNRVTEFYWLLNPDSTAKSNSLRNLVDFMLAHPRAGIAGSSIEMKDGTPWPICFRFPSILSEFERGIRLGIVTKLLSRWKVVKEMSGRQEKVDWLPGASTLIRKKTLDDVGLLDEKYFLYYEETDFCLNARRLGWECWYVPESRVMHIGGESTGVSGSDRVKEGKHDRVPQYIFDSRYRYFSKNHGYLYGCLTDAAWMAGYSIWKLRSLLERKPSSEPNRLWLDSLQNSIPFRWLKINKA